VSGRQSYAQRAWSEPRASLLATDELEPLSIDDLERLALSASLVSDVELMLGETLR
jgi:hypothetical protein